MRLIAIEKTGGGINYKETLAVQKLFYTQNKVHLTKLKGANSHNLKVAKSSCLMFINHNLFIFISLFMFVDE